MAFTVGFRVRERKKRESHFISGNMRKKRWSCVSGSVKLLQAVCEFLGTSLPTRGAMEICATAFRTQKANTATKASSLQQLNRTRAIRQSWTRLRPNFQPKFNERY